LGSAIGYGKQYMHWINIDDLCQIYLKAILDATIQGPYNAAINYKTTNTYNFKNANLLGKNDDNKDVEKSCQKRFIEFNI
jgi:NAD dependent epimerase/dehydratase family enzyme